MQVFDPNLIPIGLPWCREEDYDAFRAMLEDGTQTPETWKLFVKITEKAEHDWQIKGNAVVRVEIDPRTFPGWCSFHGHRIDSQSCYRFAAERVLGNLKRRLSGQ